MKNTFLIDTMKNGPTPIMERARKIKKDSAPVDGDYVLYWMHNAMRGHENPALDFALLAGKYLNRPVLVYQGLPEGYPYASDRLHTFILQGARDVQAELNENGISYVFHLERNGQRGSHLKTLAQKAALVVTEEMPVEPWTSWVVRLANSVPGSLWCVDTACVVPMLMTRKAYERAYLFREATKHLYEERLSRPWPERISMDSPFVPTGLPFEPVDLQTADLAELVGQCEIDHAVGPVPHTVGGSAAGYARWNAFKEKRLAQYDRRRNDATKLNGVSRMSAYLHFGMVSPFRIAREAAEQDAEKYLDELLIWRELAYHFCFHRQDNEQLTALPGWALRTLREHENDTRPAYYSWEELARGQTGDALWNACQHSLLIHGELHNNVRMTWGKALLHWTPNPLAALARLIDLNHRYALDGRDPASYGGILWCLGQFDRPFPPGHPILGTVRPRPTEDHARRLDLPAYQKLVHRPLSEPLPRVAIVGAGISGLFCARTLTDHGLSVQVFDKGRSVGGRMSTRRAVRNLSFDHGAQYFTVRDARFQRYVDSWQEQGLVELWPGRIAVLRKGDISDTKTNKDRYVGVPGMNAICKHLAQDVDVRVETQIRSLQRHESKWTLVDSEGKYQRGRFDIVLVSTPPPQAAELLTPVSPLGEQVRSVAMQGCWAVMLAFPKPLEVPFDGAFVHDSPLSWIARNSSKPGRKKEADCWILHASPEWTQEHFDTRPDSVLLSLLSEFWQVTQQTPQEPLFMQAHRWRYALPPEPLTSGCLFDPETNVGVCGDWCSGARVEGAFLSGMALAGQVLRRLPVASGNTQTTVEEEQDLLFR